MNKKFLVMLAGFTFLLSGSGNANHNSDYDDYPPLHSALIHDDFSTAIRLIENGADVNERVPDEDWDGSTPLHLAGASAEVVALLIENGADINAKGDYYNYTPLHRAESAEVVALLIENGADVNAKTRHDDTPLHWVARSASAEAVALLIENGADVNAKGDLDRTPLHEAATRFLYDTDAEAVQSKEKQEAVEVVALLIESGADVNAKSSDDVTPLHRVLIVEVASLLIENGASVSATTDRGKKTPLHAASDGSAEIVALLIENGADVNAKDGDDYTPLHRAAFSSKPNIVAILIENGADVDAKNEDGLTPLEYAMTYTIDDETIDALKSSSQTAAQAKQAAEDFKEQERLAAEAEREEKKRRREEKLREFRAREREFLAEQRRLDAEYQAQRRLDNFKASTDFLVNTIIQREAADEAQRQRQAEYDRQQQAAYERQQQAEYEQQAAEEARRQEQAAAERRRAEAAAEAERQRQAKQAEEDEKKRQRAILVAAASQAIRCVQRVSNSNQRSMIKSHFVNNCNKQVAIGYCCNNHGDRNWCHNRSTGAIRYGNLKILDPGRKDGVSPTCGIHEGKYDVHWAVCFHEKASGWTSPKATQTNGIHPTAYKCTGV